MIALLLFSIAFVADSKPDPGIKRRQVSRTTSSDASGCGRKDKKSLRTKQDTNK